MTHLFPYIFPYSYKIAEKTGWKFLGERIHTTQHCKKLLEKEEKSMRKVLARRLDWSDDYNIIQKSEPSAEVTYQEEIN